MLFRSIVFGNIFHLPRHKAALGAGHIQESMEMSRIMRAVLSQPDMWADSLPSFLIQVPAFRTLWSFVPSSLGSDSIHGRQPTHIQDFLGRAGGNLDPRFMLTTGELIQDPGGGVWIGTRDRDAEMRVKIRTNRIWMTAKLRRLPNSGDGILTADFAAFASPIHATDERYPRWKGQLVLEAGQDEVSKEVEIDGSGLSTLFTVCLPDEATGRAVAGWMNPMVTHVSADNDRPLWLSNSSRFDTKELGDDEFSAFLPDGWRPERAWLSGGRVELECLALKPEGELWIKLPDDFLTIQVRVWREDVTVFPGVTVLWYKGGRVHFQPSSQVDANKLDFTVDGAESGGWLVVRAADHPLSMRVTEVVKK